MGHKVQAKRVKFSVINIRVSNKELKCMIEVLNQKKKLIGYIDGKTCMLSSPQPEEYQDDMSDFPHFDERRWSVLDGLRVSLINLAILFLWNILFFVAAHYVFVKRSLR